MGHRRGHDLSAGAVVGIRRIGVLGGMDDGRVRAPTAPRPAHQRSTHARAAGVSPGDEDHPARWMSGQDYLAAVLLAPGEVDGLALHA